MLKLNSLLCAIFINNEYFFIYLNQLFYKSISLINFDNTFPYMDIYLFTTSYN